MNGINSMIEQIETVETSAELDYLEARIETEIDEAADAGRYPRFGYTTAQTFETPEEWIAWKQGELYEAIADARVRLSESAI